MAPASASALPPTAADPDLAQPNGHPSAIEHAGTTLYVGGSFTKVGGATRHGFVELDLATGRPTPLQLRLRDEGGRPAAVTAILRSGDVLYLSGTFAKINGVDRPYAAAVHRVTGEVLPWDPRLDAQADDMVKVGRTIYMGGFFKEIQGKRRNFIGAVDATTGAPTPWSGGLRDEPGEADGVLRLEANSTHLVAGGFMWGTPRRNFAVWRLSDGKLDPWQPHLAPDSGEFTAGAGGFGLVGEDIVMSGGFNAIDGMETGGLARFSPAERTLRPLTVPVSGWGGFGSTRMEVADGVAYSRRYGITATDTTTGEDLEWPATPRAFPLFASAAVKDAYFVGGIPEDGPRTPTLYGWHDAPAGTRDLRVTGGSCAGPVSAAWTGFDRDDATLPATVVRYRPATGGAWRSVPGTVADVASGRVTLPLTLAARAWQVSVRFAGQPDRAARHFSWPVRTYRGSSRGDRISTCDGPSNVHGGAGDDRIEGGNGWDRLLGGAGNDVLIGAGSGDLLDGGPGNDRLGAVGSKRDIVRCGPGHDIAEVDRMDLVTGCEVIIRR